MLGMTEFLNCSLENVALFRLHGDISMVIVVSAESPNQRVKALRQSHRAKTRWQKPGVALPHTPSPWRLVFIAKAAPKSPFRPFCCLFPHLCLSRVSSHQVQSILKSVSGKSRRCVLSHGGYPEAAIPHDLPQFIPGKEAQPISSHVFSSIYIIHSTWACRVHPCLSLPVVCPVPSRTVTPTALSLALRYPTPHFKESHMA